MLALALPSAVQKTESSAAKRSGPVVVRIMVSRSAWSRSVLAPFDRIAISAGHSAAATSDASNSSRSTLSMVSSASIPSDCDSSAIAPSMPPARSSQPITFSRSWIASARASWNAKSLASVMMVASARPSALSGLADAAEQYVEPDRFDHLLLLRLFQHLEARGDVGLEREGLQQPRAERVDGLHLQAARRLQRLGEQLARAGAAAWRRCA